MWEHVPNKGTYFLVVWPHSKLCCTFSIVASRCCCWWWRGWWGRLLVLVVRAGAIWITFALNWEPLIKSFLKEIGTKRTLPPLGSFLPLSSPSGWPSRHWYYNESKCWGVFFFLIVCVNEREWVVIYRSRGGMEACQCAMSAIRVPLYLSPWIKQS